MRSVPVSGLWKHASFAENAKRLLDGERFDIVHSFTRTYSQDILRLGGGVHAEYLLRMEPARSAVGRWWSRVSPAERAELDLERRCFQPGASRRIVALSQVGKQEVIRHYGVAAEEIVVIPNGVDTRRFSPELRSHREAVRSTLGLGAEDLVFLFCGSGGRRKGLPYALQALESLPDAQMIVVGAVDGPSVGGRVRFVGARDDVEPYYGASDALVLPTLYDPFPNVTLEAMASGLPVITTRVTGTAEIIENGKDSMVIEEGSDVAALAARMRELADPARRGEMSRAARDTAERYTVDRNLESNLALYGEVVRMKTA